MDASQPGPFGPSGQIEIIAHRGYSARAPENTLAAVDAAIEAGADAVEIDLQTAGDGTPVVLHDAMISRTTNGVGPVRRRTFEQLRKLDAGSWFDPAFAGERLPSFGGTLSHIGERIARVYAEVKGFRELEDVDRMARIAADSFDVGRIVFIAMKWTLLDRMRGERPDLLIGYIVSEPAEAAEAFERAKGDPRAMLDFKAEILLDDPALAERAAADGIETATWTVNDPELAEQLVAMGVHRITTDEVGTLLEWKAAR